MSFLLPYQQQLYTNDYMFIVVFIYYIIFLFIIFIFIFKINIYYRN